MKLVGIIVGGFFPSPGQMGDGRGAAFSMIVGRCYCSCRLFLRCKQIVLLIGITSFGKHTGIMLWLGSFIYCGESFQISIDMS